ncbi:uncharacterized protein LOC143448598 [Clavelina lepadiformis]|uniref:uncharacterized protein LOC143448598 n=1 Tax=Clavelina lepadiformis TaxID=159417 RepID=UPI004043742A
MQKCWLIGIVFVRFFVTRDKITMFQRRRMLTACRIGRRQQIRNLIQPINYPEEIKSVIWVDVPPDGSRLPDNAFAACIMETGETAYVAKSQIDNQEVTGFTTTNSNEAYISYGCNEHRKRNYQVIVNDHPSSLYWIVDQHGHYPKNAVHGGRDRGERLYVGRTCEPLTDGRTASQDPLTTNRLAQDGCRIGKIHPSHGCLYIPYNGREYIFDSYEVLCHKVSPGSLRSICKWKVLNVLHGNNQRKSSIDSLPLPVSLKEFLQIRTEAPLPEPRFETVSFF